MEKLISEDLISKEVLNSAKLLKNVNLNALIVGEQGVGKKSLAKYIIPESKIYTAKNLQNDIQDNIISLKNEEIIIDNIEEITNINLFLKWIEDNNIRIIAISLKSKLNEKLNDIFAITLELKNLTHRPKDTKVLIKKFSKEVSTLLDMPFLEEEKLIINLTTNAHSLRKSIYFSYLFETIGEEEILMFLEKYFSQTLKEKKTYKDLLYLFEVPLIKAANSKFKSQVQVSKNLGINRITLRKKLDIYKELL